MPVKSNKVGIVVSLFNRDITLSLAKAARTYFLNQGYLMENILEIQVPGAFEIPLATQTILPQVQGVACLGAVIEGDTDHYQYVCESVTQALTELPLKFNKPVGFGVLMTKTRAQALERAGTEHNKGEETAQAIHEMIEWLGKFNVGT